MSEEVTHRKDDAAVATRLLVDIYLKSRLSADAEHTYMSHFLERPYLPPVP
jgi:hypothetical protein